MENNNLNTKTLHELVKTLKRGIPSYHFMKNGREVRFINIADVKHGRIDPSGVRTVRVSDAGAVNRQTLEPGDVVVCTKGTNFRAALTDEPVRGFYVSSNLIAFRLSDDVLPEIVVAYLNCSQSQKELNARASGSPIKSIDTGGLMGMRIPIPENQKALAGYLRLAEQHDVLMREEMELRKRFNEGIMLRQR